MTQVYRGHITVGNASGRNGSRKLRESGTAGGATAQGRSRGRPMGGSGEDDVPKATGL